MARLLLAVLGLAATVFLLVPEEPRNEIHGFVINGGSGASKSSPIDGIYVQAIDLEGRAVDQAITGTDGQFRIVVPPSVKLFLLVAYDPKRRFWAYKPQENIKNNVHPRDIGQIALYPVSKQLSQLELQTQAEIADLLWKSNPFAATDLRGRLEIRHFVELASNNCKEEASLVADVRSTSDVSKSRAAAWDAQALSGFLPLAIPFFLLGFAAFIRPWKKVGLTLAIAVGVLLLMSVLVANLLRDRIAPNLPSAVCMLRTINTAEITFAYTYGTYAPLHMIEEGRAGLIDNIESGRSGYCYPVTLSLVGEPTGSLRPLSGESISMPVEEPLRASILIPAQWEINVNPFIPMRQRDAWLQAAWQGKIFQQPTSIFDYAAYAIPWRPSDKGVQYYYTDKSEVVRHSDHVVRNPREGEVYH